jgi:hypothetical protein
MMKNMLNEKRIPLMRSEIIRIKARAIRRGVWFRVLTRLERACIDLTIKVVERIRSRLLRKVLSSILKKLEEAIESQVWRLMREIGCSLAQKLCQIAQEWGNKLAGQWAQDSSFIKYLTITYMNKPS